MSKNPYDSIIEAWDQKTSDSKALLRASIREGTKTTPERQAEVLKLSNQTKLPPELVERNFDQIKQRTEVEANDYDRMLQDTPHVAKWVSNPNNAKLAHDDLPQLSTIETLMQYGKNLAASALATIPGTGASSRRLLQAFSENILGRTSITKEFAPMISRGLAEEAEAAETAASSVRPKASNRFEQAVYSGTEGAAQLALLAPLSLLGGEPALLAGLGASAGGSSYGEARAQGVDPTKAALFAGGSAAIQAATMKLPVGAIAKEFQLHTGLAKLLTRELMVALPSAELGTALQDLNAWAVLPENKNKTFADYVKERPGAAVDTFVSTLVGTIGTAGVTRALDRGISGKPTAQLFFENVGKAVEASKTGKRLPSELENLVSRMTKDGPIDHVYINPENWTEYWQSKKTDPRQVARELLGNDLKSYDTAVENGQPIAIPTEKYAAKIAPTEHNGYFAQHLKLDPEGMSATEEHQFLRRMSREVDEASAGDQAERTIREDLKAKMLASGRPKPEVDAISTLQAAQWRQLAERAGVDPLELYNRYPTTFGPEGMAIDPVTGEVVLSQAFNRNNFMFELARGRAGMGLRAAIKGESGEIYTGSWHGDAINKAIGAKDLAPKTTTAEIPESRQGFLISDGRFLTRNEADKEFGVKFSEEMVLHQPDDRAHIRISGPNGEGQRRVSVEFLKKADSSSFIHEMAHLHLETFGDLVDRLRGQDNLDARQQKLIADYDTALKYLGVSSRDQIGRDQHETWARSFEAYMMEGKAPSAELRSIFARVKRWMMRVYRSLKDLNVELSPEIRGVFDRMLVGDEAVSQAFRDQEARALFEDEETRLKIGMTEAEFRPYLDLVRDVRHTATEKLTAELQREEARKQQAAWKEARETIRNQVADEAYRDPVNRALANLQRGEHPNGTDLLPEERVGKLDQKALEARYGKFKDSEILKRLRQKDLYRANGGIDPDLAAELLGFKSGDDLVRRLAAAPDINQAIEAETDRRMRAAHPDLIDSGNITDKARELVNGPERSDVLMAELKAIRKKQREIEPFLKAKEKTEGRRDREARKILDALPSIDVVRAWAQRRVGETKIRELKPNLFWTSARKASQLAFEHLSRDHYQNAFDQKISELRNTELYRAARARLESVQDNIEAFGQMFQSDAKLSKTHDMDYVNAARAVASHLLNYATPYKEAALTYLGKVQRYDTETYSALQDQIAGVMESARSYKDMTVDEFDGAADVVNGLFDLARRTRQIEIDGRLMDRDTAIQALHIQASGIAKPGREQRGYKSSVSKWDKTRMQLQAAGSALRRMEFFVDAMDGGKIQGPFRRLLWNPISESLNRYRVAKSPVIARFLEILKPIESSIASGKIRAGEIDYDFANKGELLHALLHTGNESNFRKLLIGRGWGELGPDRSLVTTRWDTFIDRMKAEGVLTKADYDFAQNMWDLLETLKPGAQRAHKALYGSYFKEVEPQGFEAFGQHYRGGYVPAIVDADVDAVAGIRAGQQTFGEGDNPTMFPSTGRGFTKTRIEDYAGPLKLDLRLLPQHIDKVLLFSHVQPAVKDVSRIILNRDFQTIMGNVDPTLVPSLLIPWLQRSASQTSSTPIKGREGQLVSNVARAIRQRTSMGMLSLNVADTIGRFTTLGPTALKVRPDYLLSGLYHYLRAPREVSEGIAERSNFMAVRGDSDVAQMQTAIDDIVLNRSIAGKVQNFAARHGHFLQAGVHNLLDHMTFLGAEMQAAADGLSEPDAIRAAESAVRMTQSSYGPEDISRFEASSEPVKLVNMFFGYFNNQRQLLGNEFAFARQLGLAKGMERAAAVYVMGIMLPSVVRELVYRGVGASDMKKDEGWMDGFMDWFFGSQARYLATFVPGSSIARAGWDMWQRKPSGEHIEISPALSAVESAMRAAVGKSPYEAITTGRGKKKAIRDVLTLITLLSGWNVQPAARPLGYLADVDEGKAEPETTGDFVRGLISGRTPTR